MSINQLTDFEVNPVLDKILNGLSEKYMSQYTGFVGIVLFGSQATGRWNGESDIDIGLIYDDWSNISPDKLYQDMLLKLQQQGFRLCTHNNPGSLDLNMEHERTSYIGDLKFYSEKLAQVSDLSTIKGKQQEGKLFEMYPFCLPFGKVYGNPQKIKSAQTYVNELVQSSSDPELVETQVKRVLHFMYHR